MTARQDDSGKWECAFRYKDWKGKSRLKHARGFETEEDANRFERDFKRMASTKAGMPFEMFCELYLEEVKPRVRPDTYDTKERMIRQKIVPLFKGLALCEVTPLDVLHAQDELLLIRKGTGEPLSPVYIRRIDEQMCTLFNYAVNNYGLMSSPCKSLKQVGSNKNTNMRIWSKAELNSFLDAVSDKPKVYYAFETLYWTGIREGELLALTPEDFDFEGCNLTINKTYHRRGGKDVIGPPKTKKSYRTISIPKFLSDDIWRFIRDVAKTAPGERIFAGLDKHSLYREMRRGCAASGVKVIRVHDLRHSHVSTLIAMGFSAVAIAERMGHESTDITYRYAHLFPSAQDEMADALQAARASVS